MKIISSIVCSILVIVLFAFLLMECIKMIRVCIALAKGDMTAVKRLSTSYSEAKYYALHYFDCSEEHFSELVKECDTPYDAMCKAEEEWLNTK